MQFLGIISNVYEKFSKHQTLMPMLVPGRRIVVEITTNGQNPKVVDSIIEKLKVLGSSKTPFFREEIHGHPPIEKFIDMVVISISNAYNYQNKAVSECRSENTS